MCFPIHVPESSSVIGISQSEDWIYGGMPPEPTPCQSIGYQHRNPIILHIAQITMRLTIGEGNVSKQHTVLGCDKCGDFVLMAI